MKKILNKKMYFGFGVLILFFIPSILLFFALFGQNRAEKIATLANATTGIFSRHRVNGELHA